MRYTDFRSITRRLDHAIKNRPTSPTLQKAHSCNCVKMAVTTFLLHVFVLGILCSRSLGDYTDLAACTYTDDSGKKYDLSPLSKG